MIAKLFFKSFLYFLILLGETLINFSNEKNDKTFVSGIVELWYEKNLHMTSISNDVFFYNLFLSAKVWTLNMLKFVMLSKLLFYQF